MTIKIFNLRNVESCFSFIQIMIPADLFLNNEQAWRVTVLCGDRGEKRFLVATQIVYRIPQINYSMASLPS